MLYTIVLGVGFYHITTWVNHKYAYILPSWTSTPSHPSRLSQSTVLNSLLYNNFPLVICFTYGKVYVSVLLSQFGPPSPYPVVSKVCSLCLRLYSCPTNMFIGTVFLDSIYVCVNVQYFVFLFLTYFTLHTLGSSTSLELTQVLVFLGLSSIPFHLSSIYSFVSDI